MKTVAGLLMITKAALFFFSGVQHAGVSVGRFHEPHIIPAVIAKSLCGLCLLWARLHSNGTSGQLSKPACDGFIDVHQHTSLRILVSAWAR